MERGRKIGITSTVPVEAILAAGHAPVDLNNIFIGSSGSLEMVNSAESAGFPSNVCAWIKGLHEAALTGGVSAVVGVTRGDCSSTEKLLELWELSGFETIGFAYPFHPDPAKMRRAIDEFCERLGTTVRKAESWRKELIPLRARLEELDQLTWRTGQVSGAENHQWLVGASDFRGDPAAFEKELEEFLSEARRRKPCERGVKLGFAGVPPILDDLYESLEAMDCRVVFNEVQRQFAMPGRHASLADQYTAYTYPYSTFYRIADIKREMERRGVRGLIHYTQTFCHRQLETMLLVRELSTPVATVEADKPGPVDARTRTRLQAFIEQLGEIRAGKGWR